MTDVQASVREAAEDDDSYELEWIVDSKPGELDILSIREDGETVHSAALTEERETVVWNIGDRIDGYQFEAVVLRETDVVDRTVIEVTVE